jgi:hypothetical protein
MAGDRYEPNRVLGFPYTRNPRVKRDEEPRRVMGFPVDVFSGIGLDADTDWAWALMHPVRGYRRWLRRRRLGPYATDEDGPRQDRPGG